MESHQFDSNVPSNFLPQNLDQIKRPIPTRTCLDIFQKDPQSRTKLEVSRLVKYLENLKVFKRAILTDTKPLEVIAMLTNYMKVETFTEDTAIYHLEKHADKMYIIMQGTAKEFIPKTISEVEREYRENPQYMAPLIPKIKILNEAGKQADMKKSPSLKAQKSGESLPKKNSLMGLDSVTEENANGSRESIPSRSSRKKTTLNLPKNMKSVNYEKKDSLGVPQSNDNTLSPTPSQIQRESSLSPYSSESARRRDISPGSTTRRTSRKSNYAYPMSDENNNDEEIHEEFWRYPEIYMMGRIMKVKLNRLLQMGDCIGMDVLEGKTIQRTAVLTMRDCVVVSLSRDDFLRVLRQRRAGQRVKIEFFNKVFVERSDQEHVTSFSMFWEVKEMRKNEVIFKQDQPASHIYLLAEGEVILSRTLTDMKDAVKVFQDEVQIQAKKKNGVTEAIHYVFKVGIVTKDHIFGEKDFFEEAPRNFTATVTSVYAKFYKLSLEDYKQIRESYPDVISEMLKKSVYQSSWKQERLDDFYEQNNLERTPHHQYSNYIDSKLRAFESVPKYSEKFLYLKKPRIKPVDKAKLEPLLEYLKFVIPKAGQNVPDYLEYLAEEIRNQDLTQNVLKGLDKQGHGDLLSENDDWFPFIKGRVTKRSSAEREYPKSQEQSPRAVQRALEVNEPGASIYRKKLAGSISSIDTSMFTSKQPQNLESMKASRPTREFNTTPMQKTTMESQPTKEDLMIPIRNGLKIPKLILEQNNNHKIDLPLPIMSMSSRGTPNVLKIAKERLQFAARHDFANTPTGLSSVSSRKGRFCATDRFKEDSVLTMLTKPNTPAQKSSFVYRASPRYIPGPFFSLSIPADEDNERKTPAFEEPGDVLSALPTVTKHKRSTSDIENHAPLSIVNSEKGKNQPVVWPIMHKRNLSSGNLLGVSKLRSSAVDGDYYKLENDSIKILKNKSQPISARGASLDIMTRSQFRSPRERPPPVQLINE